jgi:hydrogenase maturation protease
MIRIIGIGSPFGDDAAGLEAARQLAATPLPDTEVVVADRPGAALIDLFDGADAVILIDAARSAMPPGTVHDLDLRMLAPHSIGLVSSHDLGVSEAIRLAGALGRLPSHGRVLGIEASAESLGCIEADAVQAGIAAAVTRAREWCAAYHCSDQRS